MKLLPLLALLLCSCVNGKWAGPPLSLGVEFMGARVSLGIPGTVAGDSAPARGILISESGKEVRPLHPAP